MAAITVDTLSKGSNFDPKLVKDLITKVQGKSALAKLSGQIPVAFTGTKEMVFDMPNGIDIVAENGAKSHGGATVSPVVITPIKFEYGARISDEFLYASEEEQLNILESFNDGFAKKVAEGLDIAAMHGINPRSGSASTVVGNNHLDSKVSQTVTTTSAVDDNLQSAIGLVQGAGYDVTGIALAPTFATSLGNVKANGVPLYPEFRFGQAPENFAGNAVDVNRTVATADNAIVGDFENYFKWGIAKEIPVEIIPYGDPDNSGSDLKGHNQIYVRAEVYLGWGILVPTAFARVIPASN